MMEQAIRFLQFYLRADGIYQAHSPLLYKLLSEVVEPRSALPFEEIVERARAAMLADETSITFQEYGAGSTSRKQNAKTISSIASSSLSGVRQCRQLARLVQLRQPKTILEMGTSLGISTMYMAAADLHSEVYTLEGDPKVSQIAQTNFEKAHLLNIQLRTGIFEETLQHTLEEIKTVDLAFIDGNHRYRPTVDYFEQILKYSNRDTLLIFDDIHWSAEMEKAWLHVQNHPSITLTVDLFHMGIAILADGLPKKSHRSFIEWRYKPWKIGLFG